MKYRNALRMAAFVFVAGSLSLGFYAIPQKWQINAGDPTVWIKFCEEPTFSSFSYPKNDPLYGTRGQSFDQVVQSILDDVNTISTSYLRVARYPDNPDDPGEPEEGDSEFTTDRASRRTIDVCFAETSFNVAGFAETTFTGNSITACKITLAPDYKVYAGAFISVLTHELGHCLGLMHPQDTVHSIMSYFHDDSLGIRYESDDKMGITFLYPQDSSYGNERASYGAACKQK